MSFRFRDGTQRNGVPVAEAIELIVDWIAPARQRQPDGRDVRASAADRAPSGRLGSAVTTGVGGRAGRWRPRDGVGHPGRLPPAVDAAPAGLHQGRRRRAGCPFCRIPTLADEEGLVVARGEVVYAVLNLHPYNPGHLMVLPYRHVAELEDLTEASRPS